MASPKYAFFRSLSRGGNTSAAARRRLALIQRWCPILLLVLAVVGVPLLLLSEAGFSRLELLQHEQETVALEISRLNKRIEALRAETEEIRKEPDAVERVARDQLGLVRQTDGLFHFEK